MKGWGVAKELYKKKIAKIKNCSFLICFQTGNGDYATAETLRSLLVAAPRWLQR